MSEDFFIPEERLATLKATPAGRSGDGGYNYQRAYAVARLAAMCTAQPLLSCLTTPGDCATTGLMTSMNFWAMMLKFGTFVPAGTQRFNGSVRPSAQNRS